MQQIELLASDQRGDSILRVNGNAGKPTTYRGFVRFMARQFENARKAA